MINSEVNDTIVDLDVNETKTQVDEVETKASPERSNQKILKVCHLSPQREPSAKKIRIEVSSDSRKHIPIHNYGNYDRYYGYRNFKYFDDIRLDAFKQNVALSFSGLDVLDIGCNNGLITIALARDFQIKSIIGIDIDKSLIRRAREHMILEKKQCTSNQTDTETFPNNIIFKQGNYVLTDEALLELEQPQFNTILCLSVTKWIHLNFGDSGLKIAFKRMFKQLRSGGQLVLEAQDWKSYKRRKKLTETIYENFKNIKLLPNKFEEYLLSSEVGFTRSFFLDLPKHKSNGFCRPIQVTII